MPIVLNQDEIQPVLTHMCAEHALLTMLLYCTGMRLNEALQLRIRDLDFDHRTMVIRLGKNRQDRTLLLPDKLMEPLLLQLARARKIWSLDRANEVAGVCLPGDLARLSPRAGWSWQWFWVFPQRRLSINPRSGGRRRHHLNDPIFQRALQRAVKSAGLSKPVTPQTLRLSFATNLLHSGYDTTTVQRLLGHKDASTTIAYTHGLSAGASPLERSVHASARSVNRNPSRQFCQRR